MRPSVFRVLFICSVSFVIAIAGPAFGQAPADSAVSAPKAVDNDAVAAIHSESAAFVEAFNRQDAEAIGKLWTEDGEYVDESGQRFDGREAIVKEYAAFFEAAGTPKIKLTIDSVRLLSDRTAIEDGSASVEPAPEGVRGVSRYVAVHVKVGDRWQMASVRETWSEMPAENRAFEDLDWLVGTWATEEHGAQIQSVYQWDAARRFLERTYSTKRFDGSQTTGRQLIGWNADLGRLQSWTFSDDGGHAVGFWTEQPEGWLIETEGLTGDGTPTTSVVLLRKLDDKAYAWQSVARGAGGQMLPDTDEIVLKRQP
jgi:uncharacterized protein (TIGR02246 family)